MKLKFRQSILFFLLSAALYPQEMARTDSGKWVMLEPDGTWRYVKPASETPLFTKPASALSLKRTADGKIGLWYDSLSWKPALKFINPGSAAEFSHPASGGYALLLYDKGYVKLKELKESAVQMIKRADASAEILKDQTYYVNDSYVDHMYMKAKVGKDVLIYMNYYYAGKAGNMQLITYCKESEAARFQAEFADFLNGLVIYVTDGVK